MASVEKNGDVAREHQLVYALKDHWLIFSTVYDQGKKPNSDMVEDTKVLSRLFGKQSYREVCKQLEFFS